jgi:large subunit ribosomal protein L5
MKEKYRNEVVPRLKEVLGYKNVMQIPRLEKIVVNVGLGEAIQNAKAMEAMENDIVAIVGQHPVITRSKKSIAAFRLREGMPVGLKVTLRGERMYQFFEKLVCVVLPHLHDFQGISPSSFDGRGNYALGFKEQIAFPEIEYDKIDKVRGLEVIITTTAQKDEDGRHLLELMGMPFAKDGSN